MDSYFSGKHIVVTGGAGAFGRRFLPWVAAAAPASVTVYSRDEMKHASLKRELGGYPWLRCQLGDITDASATARVIRGSNVVIHAAAMKHLPECEDNPAMSCRTNVDGTRNVVDAFHDSAADTLVFLSTDKAPYASSIYGAQKMIGERLVASASRGSGKRALTMRYSNVIDSTGAVFPLFQSQIAAGRPLKVNGREMRRGFLSQEDVLTALDRSLRVSRGGEVFVLVPKVIRIADLADALCACLERGTVEVAETKGFAGEKESATLVMAEEFRSAKSWPEAEGGGFLIDTLGRHSERAPTEALLGRTEAFTLEDCPVLEGAPLVDYVRRLVPRERTL